MNPAVEQARHAAFQQTLLSARRTMLMSEILKLAIDSFRASKLRFALTALGMVIGTASVILVVTIGLTGRQFILNEIQKIGTNEVEVEYAGGGAVGAEKVQYNDFLTREDEKAVLAQVPSVVASSPVLESHDRISFGGGVVKDTLVLGVSPQYKDVRNLIVLSGRFFDDQDETAHMMCAVVTVPFARDMFGSTDAALGKEFSIQGIPFTIVGIFKESVDTFGETEIADETILIPFSVARYFTGTDNVKQIYFTIRSMDEVPDATREIQRVIQVATQGEFRVYKTFDLRELLAMADRNCDCADCGAGAGGRGHARSGRRGHYEHHAGQRARAYSRDRHSQGAGCDVSRDQAAVSGRGGHHLAGRRTRGLLRGACRAAVHSALLGLSASDFARGRW